MALKGFRPRVLKQYLKQKSESTANDRYPLVILDDAGWHTQDVAAEFDNL
jgi:hypothetical protein